MNRTLESYLHEHIPLSKAMGIEVKFASPERVLLTCPLEPNRNHQNTGFGGSIGALAMLAGWSWLWVMMRERETMPKLVLKECKIDFLAPIQSDFSAELRPPSDEAIGEFIRTFDRRGSGGIFIDVEVLCEGESVAQFQGSYVATRA